MTKYKVGLNLARMQETTKHVYSLLKVFTVLAINTWMVGLHRCTGLFESLMFVQAINDTTHSSMLCLVSVYFHQALKVNPRKNFELSKFYETSETANMWSN